MSMPMIPNITPTISLKRCDSMNLLLSSIALEEIGLSNILNAEGKKMEHFLQTDPVCINDYLTLNESINRTLRTIVKSQVLLGLKLEEVAEIDKRSNCGVRRKRHCTCKKRKKHPCTCDKCCSEKSTSMCKYCRQEALQKFARAD